MSERAKTDPRDRLVSDGRSEEVDGVGVWVPDGMSGRAIMRLALRVRSVVDVGPYSARCIARELIALGHIDPSNELIERANDRYNFC